MLEAKIVLYSVIESEIVIVALIFEVVIVATIAVVNVAVSFADSEH